LDKKKSILLKVDEDLYKSIHRLMGHTLVSDGITIEKLHYGKAQDFYRRLLTLGIGVLKKEWDEKVKDFESKDSH
jgi:hypothetical protein